MCRSTKRRLTWAAAAVLALIGLAAFSPSYSYVRVTGPGQDVEVERAGTGPQSVEVRTPDATVRSTTW